MESGFRCIMVVLVNAKVEDLIKILNINFSDIQGQNQTLLRTPSDVAIWYMQHAIYVYSIHVTIPPPARDMKAQTFYATPNLVRNMICLAIYPIHPKQFKKALLNLKPC